jgi:glutathione-independent formaldehyde dehydrogenase
MVRGRTTAEKGLVLGHEITGEVIELGRDVEFIKKGDIVSVPLMFVAAKKNGLTGICLNVNGDRWRSLRICGMYGC